MSIPQIQLSFSYRGDFYDVSFIKTPSVVVDELSIDFYDLTFKKAFFVKFVDRFPVDFLGISILKSVGVEDILVIVMYVIVIFIALYLILRLVGGE
ncbi:MAG: hypothetical protein QXK24_06900 [Ignisphaera sp.]